MMKKLLDGLSESTSFQAVYDIACILTRHLKVTSLYINAHSLIIF